MGVALGRDAGVCVAENLLHNGHRNAPPEVERRGRVSEIFGLSASAIPFSAEGLVSEEQLIQIR